MGLSPKQQEIVENVRKDDLGEITPELSVQLHTLRRLGAVENERGDDGESWQVVGEDDKPKRSRKKKG